MIRHQVVVPGKPDGQRLIPTLIAAVAGLTSGQVYKALKKKDVRLNGKRLQADQIVQPGDVIELFLPETGAQTEPGQSAQSLRGPALQVVFSDHRLLILNKQAGLVVHGGGPADALADDDAETNTLIAQARSQFGDPKLTLCHRLDRNTGGLIILARSAEIQQTVVDLMKAGLLTKRYRCLVRGEPLAGQLVRSADNKKFWQLDSFLEKRASRSEVFIHDEQRPGDLPVTTRYRILRCFPEFGPDFEPVSELEVELVTGRTHQIRAHLAHFGHPLLGDGKYGRNTYNRHFKTRSGGALRYQQLFACQLSFSPAIRQGPLADLAGQTIAIEPAYDLELPMSQ